MWRIDLQGTNDLGIAHNRVHKVIKKGLQSSGVTASLLIKSKWVMEGSNKRYSILGLFVCSVLTWYVTALAGGCVYAQLAAMCVCTRWLLCVYAQLAVVCMYAQLALHLPAVFGPYMYICRVCMYSVSGREAQK